MNTSTRKNTVPAGDFNTFLVVLLTVSIFLPFYVSVAAVALSAILIVFNYEKRAEAFRDPYSKFLVSIFILSFFVSTVYSNHVGVMYALLLTAAVICCFYLRSFMTEKLFNTSMDLACLCSLACGALAVMQKVAHLGVSPEYRPVSTFLNANYYGTIAEFMILIALYRVFTHETKKQFYFLTAGVNVLGLYLSASMSAFVATVLGLIVMLAMKKKFRVAGAMAALAVTFSVACVFFPEFFPRIALVDQSWGQRLDIWNTAFKGIRSHPWFGQGFMSYQMVCVRYFGYRTYHAHNLFIDSLLNLGIVGLSAVGFYFFTQLRTLIARFRSGISTETGILLLSMFSAVLIHGLTDVTAFWIQTGLLFLMVASSLGIGAAESSSDCHVPDGVLLTPRYGVKSRAGVLYYDASHQ